MAEASTSSASCRPYKLSRELVGHEAEVLALAVFKNGSIVSASKDKTARLWAAQDGNYAESIVMKGHSDDVYSVCVIEPTEKNPTGFIITGSSDKTVCIYYPGDEQPVHTVQAHEKTVYDIKASAFETESFLTCSLDGTGKLWDLYDLKKSTVTFSGHVLASTVWCIADLENGVVITGGSDKIVTIYERNGRILHKLSGHLSSVRNIAVINSTDFLSCSHDTEIRLWNAITGMCLQVYHGHTDQINSITADVGGNLAVSCGKNRTLKVWCKGKVEQTMFIPTETIWDVKLLSNKDIVCGSSDGVVRLFTVDVNRVIDKESMQRYQKRIIKNRKHFPEDKHRLEKIEKKMYDERELNEPGEKDGDTVIIKKKGRVMVYRWSTQNYQWHLVGDVLENKFENSGKPTYNGIEYDYVFSVDIKKNAPFLKLPYNKGQDPYEAARQFLEDNDLPLHFLDQVANFIMTNIQIKPILNAEAQHQNPFDGGSRYVSNAWSDISSKNTNSNSCDTKYIPHKNYLKLEQGNISSMIDKLIDFNTTNKDKIQSIEDDKLKSLVILTSSENSVSTEEQMSNLISLLSWPDDIVFPVLDITRLAVLQKNVNEKFCTSGIFDTLKRHIQKDAIIPNQMLTFRLLSNLFCHKKGEEFCLQCKNEVLDAIKEIPSFQNKNNEIAVSTYILNLVIALNKKCDIVSKEQILSVISRLLEMLKESEAIFRVLVGLGSLLVETLDINNRKFIIKSVMGFRPILTTLKTFIEKEKSSEVPTKLVSVSKQIVKLIR